MKMKLADEQIYKTLYLADARYSLIDSDHGQSTNYKLELSMLSKFSVMEFCGWIEVSMDSILKAYLKLKVKNNKALLDEANDDIDRVYGCDPRTHIRPMVRKILGVKSFARYVKKFADLDQICASVELIGGKPSPSCLATGVKSQPKSKRNVAAHTCLMPSTQAYFNAPSKVMHELRVVHPLLWKFRESILRSF